MLLGSPAGAAPAAARGGPPALHLRGVRRALQAPPRLRHTHRHAQRYNTTLIRPIGRPFWPIPRQIGTSAYFISRTFILNYGSKGGKDLLILVAQQLNMSKDLATKKHTITVGRRTVPPVANRHAATSLLNYMTKYLQYKCFRYK